MCFFQWRRGEENEKACLEWGPSEVKWITVFFLKTWKCLPSHWQYVTVLSQSQDVGNNILLLQEIQTPVWGANVALREKTPETVSIILLRIILLKWWVREGTEIKSVWYWPGPREQPSAVWCPPRCPALGSGLCSWGQGPRSGDRNFELLLNLYRGCLMAAKDLKL